MKKIAVFGHPKNAKVPTAHGNVNNSLLQSSEAHAAFWLAVCQVFRNPYEVVTVLLIQTLGAMVPSIPVCLSTAMERTPQEEKLEALLELYQTAANFGRNLEAAMLPHLGKAEWSMGDVICAWIVHKVFQYFPYNTIT